MERDAWLTAKGSVMKNQQALEGAVGRKNPQTLEGTVGMKNQQTLEGTVGMNEPTTFEEELQRHGILVYTNVGCSMMPLLRQKRDLVEIAKKQPGRCKKYDVVLYRRGGKYILHRILKVLPDSYVIAGDHNYVREYGVKDDQIIGVLAAVVRDGRRITVNDRGYRLYVHLWCDLYPFRVGILYMKARLKNW
jgi:hypothetical protein